MVNRDGDAVTGRRIAIVNKTTVHCRSEIGSSKEEDSKEVSTDIDPATIENENE